MVSELSDTPEAVEAAPEITDSQELLLELRQERDTLRDRAWMLQRLLDAHVQASSTSQPGEGPCSARASNPVLTLRLPPEAQSLPPYFRGLLSDWISDFQNAQQKGNHEAWTAYFRGQLDRVHLCDLAHQDHSSPAATECLRVMGLLNITVIRHSQRHCPRVLAAIGHNLRKHNAAYPRGALIGAHFKGITSLQLKKEQAESIALAAQKFQAESQLLQRQRADILATLQEGYENQPLLGTSCGSSNCGLAASEQHLLQLRTVEQRNHARLVDAVLGPMGALEGLKGLLVHVRMRPMCLDLHVLGHIVLDQVNRYCTVSLLHQAKTASCAALTGASDEADLEDSDLPEDLELPLRSSLHSAVDPSPGFSVAQGSTRPPYSPHAPASKRRAVQQAAALRPPGPPSSAASQHATPSETAAHPSLQGVPAALPFQLSSSHPQQQAGLSSGRSTEGVHSGTGTLGLSASAAQAPASAGPTAGSGSSLAGSMLPRGAHGAGRLPSQSQPALGQHQAGPVVPPSPSLPASAQTGPCTGARPAAELLSRPLHPGGRAAQPSIPMQPGGFLNQTPPGWLPTGTGPKSGAALSDGQLVGDADPNPSLTDPNFAPLLEELLSWQ